MLHQMEISTIRWWLPSNIGDFLCKKKYLLDQYLALAAKEPRRLDVLMKKITIAWLQSPLNGAIIHLMVIQYLSLHILAIKSSGLNRDS